MDQPSRSAELPSNPSTPQSRMDSIVSEWYLEEPRPTKQDPETLIDSNFVISIFLSLGMFTAIAMDMTLLTHKGHNDRQSHFQVATLCSFLNLIPPLTVAIGMYSAWTSVIVVVVSMWSVYHTVFIWTDPSDGVFGGMFALGMIHNVVIMVNQQ